MSGHSKWHNIRVKKMAGAAARGKIFTKHARLVEIAAREGGGDPATNARLRTAIDAARGENVPNANIERAIRKGTGELKGAAMEELLLEAYGPAGTAYLIECLTDNRNRTLGSLRTIVSKHGGTLAQSGAVAWQFERKGVVVGRDEGRGTRNQDALQLELMDLGVEDIDMSDETIDITTEAKSWVRVRDLLKERGYGIVSAGLKYIPKRSVEITNLEQAWKVQTFMETLEEDDDVADVHTNADISEEIAKRLA